MGCYYQSTAAFGGMWAQVMSTAEIPGDPHGLEVRSLNLSDLSDALELSRLVGWNQTEADWRRVVALSPEGCFCIQEGGRVVATTTLVGYDRDCAWIGMVLTHPDWRGRGFARKLLGHTLAISHKLGIATVKLDATAQGQPLYESFGFIPEQLVERWERAGDSGFAESVQSYSAASDEAAYGYSRAQLLQALAGASAINDAESYVLTRPGATKAYIGPCIAEDAEAAEQLMRPILDAAPGCGWFWDLLIENCNATKLASTLGFKPVRRLARMSLGKHLKERQENIYALAGLEFG